MLLLFLEVINVVFVSLDCVHFYVFCFSFLSYFVSFMILEVVNVVSCVS